MVNRFIASVLIVLLCPLVQAASSVQSDLDEVLRRKPDVEAGERKFIAACSACHGAAGEGQPQGLAPRIAGQHRSVIASQLVDYRHGRRLDDRMQGRASEHVLPKPQDIADVAAYAAELPGGAAAPGPGAALAEGAQLYANRCSECHGAQAQGSAQRAVPRLAAQNFGYLSRQLQEFVEGRRPAAGRDHLQQLRSLDRNQITAIADHLSRLP